MRETAFGEEDLLFGVGPFLRQLTDRTFFGQSTQEVRRCSPSFGFRVDKVGTRVQGRHAETGVSSYPDWAKLRSFGRVCMFPTLAV